jgi:hypothetical protein
MNITSLGRPKKLGECSFYCCVGYFFGTFFTRRRNRDAFIAAIAGQRAGDQQGRAEASKISVVRLRAD